MTKTKDAICDWDKVVYEDFAYLHGALNTRFRDLILASLKRVAASQQHEQRILHIRLLLRVVQLFLLEYNGNMNAFLRQSRRSLVSFLKSCVAGKSDILEISISNINKLHTFVDNALNKVMIYMGEEKSDENEFADLITQTASLRARIDRNRYTYVRAFATFNFAAPLLMDGHFAVMYVIKCVRAALLYLIIRVARQWFENDFTAPQKADKAIVHSDVSQIVYRIAIIIVLLDVALVSFVYLLDNALASKDILVPRLSLWTSILCDCVLSDAVILFVAFMLARVFQYKKYFRIKENNTDVIDAYVNIITKVSLVTSALPYFMMA